MSGKQTSKPAKPVSFRDGWSTSVWASLAVKSLRIGWPEGLRQAAKRLAPSAMKSEMVCGLFEDVFPTREELPECLAEIARQGYDGLCARETHHGRGMTSRFCELEPEAMRAMYDRRGELFKVGRELGIWLPPRSLNCLWTWLRIEPKDSGVRRAVDEAPWEGMPRSVIDQHTHEGKRLGIGETVLSGSYEQHLRIAQRVEVEGWEPIRREVHEDILPVPGPEAATEPAAKQAAPVQLRLDLSGGGK